MSDEAQSMRVAYAAAFKSAAKAASDAEADSDALAAIVAEYIKICDETALLIKDEFPPKMAAERAALSNHEKLVKERRNEPSRSES